MGIYEVGKFCWSCSSSAHSVLRLPCVQLNAALRLFLSQLKRDEIPTNYRVLFVHVL